MSRAFLLMGLALLGCDDADKEPDDLSKSCATVCERYESCDLESQFGYSNDECVPACTAQGDEADAECEEAFAGLADCVEDVPCSELEAALDEGGECFIEVLQLLADCQELEPAQFDCGGDVEVPVQWLCDDEADCPSGIDESPDICELPCDDRVFQCADAVSTEGDACVSQGWVCDGFDDCDDGSDEAECE